MSESRDRRSGGLRSGRSPRRGVGAAASAGGVLATLAAASNVGAVAAGTGWWWTGALVSAVAVGAAVLTRLLLRAWPVPLLVSLLVGGWLICLVYAAPTLLLGVVPTASTVDRFRELVEAAGVHIAAETMPASPAPPLDLLIVAGITGIAILVDTVAVSARKPVLAALPLLLVAILPGRAAGGSIELMGLSFAVGSVLLLVWLDRRRDLDRASPVAAAAVAGIAVLGAVVGQAVAPAFDDATPASAALRPVFATGADPLVRLGDHLRRGLDVEALSYRTSAVEPVYLRVVSIADLDGEEWSTDPLDDETAGRDLAAFAAPAGLADEVERRTVETTVVDQFAERRWLPVPYPATSVSELSDAEDWAFDPDSLAVGSLERSEPTGEYVVSSLELSPTAEQLRAADPAPPTLLRYLQLPADMPSIIGETTSTVVADEATDYDRALAIQSYLRGGEFRYDENTPEEADGDGDSFDVLATFLADKRGYCVHFASAMTVMARQAGIPARIAVGYQPGERQIGEPGLFEVTAHDLHAWPELYFEGVGWTRFEPTPGRGDVPDYDAAAAQQQGQQERQDDAPTPTPTPSAAQRENDPGAAGPTGAGGSGSISVPLVVSAGVLALLLVPAVVRLALRRRRLAALRDGDPSAGWDELHDTAIDLGLSPAQVSPRTLEEQLVGVGAGVDGLEGWRAAVERSRFGRDGSSGGVDVEVARRALAAARRSQSFSRRVIAALAPLSLVSRVPRPRWLPRPLQR